MYRKMLLIGIGGSGGKTLRFLKRDLGRWLDSRGWTGGVPDGWQFLHIDSPTSPDGLEAGGTALTSSEYLGLVSAEMTLKPVIDQVDGVPNAERELAGWRVDPDAVRVPIATGAGQYRAVGRSIGLAFSGAIREGLDRSIQRLSSAGAQATLDLLYTHVHSEEPSGGQPSAPIPVVISSLAGGTGAGLLLDVMDILRSLEPAWADQSMGLWYTPDVFPHNVGDGIYPNSLAAISELLNGAWWGGSAGVTDLRATKAIPAKESALLTTLAKTPHGLAKSGAHCNFLIGSTNASGAQIATDGTLFEMVGGALLSWMTDLNVQQTFVAYQVSNWTQRATENIESRDVVTNQGAPEERGLPAFSALGFARVSVGTEYLRRYSARRIAAEAARHLADAHTNSERARQEARAQNISSPDRLVEQLVAVELPLFRRFANVMAVDESDISDDWAESDHPLSTLIGQIERAFTPDSLDGWIRQQRVTISRRDAPNDDVLTADAWVEQLLPGMREAQRALDQHVTAALPELVDAWVRTTAGESPIAIEQTAAEHGLRVTIGLIETLIDELTLVESSVVTALRHFALQAREWADTSQIRSGMFEAFEQAAPRQKMRGDTDMVQQAIERGVLFAQYSARALIAERVALLVERWAQGFLRPLAQALRDSWMELAGNAATIEAWPAWSGGLPPKDVTPPLSEYTVIEALEFAERFDALLQQTYPDMGKLEARIDVRREAAGGQFVRRQLEPLGRNAPERPRFEALTMLSFEQQWRPGFEVAGDSSPSRNAVVAARCTPTDLEARADRWLMRDGFPFEQLLSVNLRTYTRPPDGVREDDPEYLDRQSRVLAKLDQAVVAAAPLIEIQEDLIGVVHPALGGGAGGRFTQNLSTIPFRGHPLEQRVRERLVKTVYAGGQEEFDKALTSDSDLPYIDIISSLKLPVSPLVVASLTRPIAEEWTSVRKNPRQRASFWEHRRSRPLREFVPIPQRHLRCMLRGWFTGRMLGLIDTNDVPFKIMLEPQGSNPRIGSFPSEFLSPTTGGTKDHAALVLESYSLALVEVARVSSLEPLAPFQTLRDLGMSDPNSSAILHYPHLNPIIDDWIKSGVVAGTDTVHEFSGKLHPRLGGETADERRASFGRLLDDVASDYAAAYDQYLNAVRADRHQLSRTPYWPGIVDEIHVALTCMRRATDVQEATGTGL